MKLQQTTITYSNKEGDPRVGSFLGKKPAKYTIIGFPSDAGVAINGGRIGASKAPNEIRKAFYNLTPDPTNYDSFKSVLEQTEDKGDLVLTGDLESDYELLSDFVAEELSSGRFPLIIGGGHETSYGHFLGYVKARLKVGIINLDAHTDVRKLVDGKAHSGSPFRQALEHESRLCSFYHVLGLQKYSVSKEQLDFLKEHSCRYIFKENLKEQIANDLLARINEDVMATIDLDVIRQCEMRAVSAPCANGIRAEVVYSYARTVGSNKNIKSFDLVEFNPEFDKDGHAARVAAVTLWSFVRGLAER